MENPALKHDQEFLKRVDLTNIIVLELLKESRRQGLTLKGLFKKLENKVKEVQKRYYSLDFYPEFPGLPFDDGHGQVMDSDRDNAGGKGLLNDLQIEGRVINANDVWYITKQSEKYLDYLYNKLK
jgi:hypothetical protein